MSAVVATELLKLRATRATWVVLAVAVTLSTARVVMVMGSAGTAAGVERGTWQAATTLAWAAATGSVLVLLLGVLAATGEHRHRTLTGTLLGVPDRGRVVLAKTTALALTGAVAAASFTTAGFVVAAATGLSGPLDAGSVARVLAVVSLTGALWGWYGVSVGLLVGSQTLALFLPVAWFLVIEPLVGSFGLDAVTPWLPGNLVAVLAGGAGPGAPAVWAALAALVAYGLTLAAPGARLLSRKDVT